MRWLMLLTLCFLGIDRASNAKPPQDDWRLVFSDDFNRTTIGANWRWVFGSGRQYLVDHAIHLSHSSTVWCVVPLPHDEMRVELDLLLPSQSFSGTSERHSIHLELRSGEVGAGGNQERFELVLVPRIDAEQEAKVPTGAVRIELDRPYRVALQIRKGIGTAEVDGETVQKRPVTPAVSEVNRFFVFSTKGLNGIPGREATLDNFQIYSAPTAVAKLPLVRNSAESNKQATRFAKEFIDLDPGNPAIGIQQAIDSLPVSGGAVILPEGEFLMRRHLKLRSHVTLTGQGAGRTILKAIQGEPCPILQIRSTPTESVVSVAIDQARKFQIGDAVCFNHNWGHPTHLDTVNKDCVVTAIENDTITVHGTAPEAGSLESPAWLAGTPVSAPAKEIRRWFPQVFAHCAEFVELKDLTIIGGVGGWGGFESAAVTFGQVSGARVSRVHIAKWEGDGLSFQTVGDAIVTDNTVTDVYQGYHPGTCTQRFLCSRNLGEGNRSCGLYFCWFNRNGVYQQNLFDRFDGFGWPGDVFNIIHRNRTTSPKGFAIEQGEGGGGIVFNNQFPEIRLGHGVPGAPTFDFVVAQNRADTLQFVVGDVKRNLIAGNQTRNSESSLHVNEPREGNLVLDRRAEIDLKNFAVGARRTDALPPPSLPRPILEGADYYRSEQPDAGFQSALNELKDIGGTLLLPAGRYALSQSLNVPTGVTLAGRGLCTVLQSASVDQTCSLIVAEHAARVVVRDLVVLGEYERQVKRAAAIQFQDVNHATLIAVDVRGWEGVGARFVCGTASVCDCRALGCASNGFEFDQCQVECVGSIARECANGFVVEQSAEQSLLEANISSGNRGEGYQIDRSIGIQVIANNASFNDRNGILVTKSTKLQLIANMLANNNQSSVMASGIQLGPDTEACQLYYNNVQDGQVQPTQTKAIVEDSTATNNRIRFNLTRMPLEIKGQGSNVSDNFKP